MSRLALDDLGPENRDLNDLGLVDSSDSSSETSVIGGRSSWSNPGEFIQMLWYVPLEESSTQFAF